MEVVAGWALFPRSSCRHSGRAAAAEAMTAPAQTKPDAFVLDTSALLMLYLPDGPLPLSLELAMQRKCSGGALLLKQVQRQLLSLDECRSLFADLLQLPLRPTKSSELALAALEQANALSLGLYDASFLALASDSCTSVCSDYRCYTLNQLLLRFFEVPLS